MMTNHLLAIMMNRFTTAISVFNALFIVVAIIKRIYGFEAILKDWVILVFYFITFVVVYPTYMYIDAAINNLSMKQANMASKEYS